MKNIEENLKNNMMEALRSDNPEEQAKAVVEYMDSIAKDLADKFEEIKDSRDEEILSKRGFAQLTSKEKSYFEKLADAIKTNQALTGDFSIPTTTIERVFEELEAEHPLLAEIQLENVTGITEIMLRTGDVDLAVWGPLCAEITKEIAAGFKKESVNVYKLSAFLPVCKSYLELGPTWLEAFVRRILVEALSLGLEKGIISGNGKEMPIGMDKNLEGSVTQGVYPDKTAEKLADFEPVTILSKIAQLTNGGKRKVSSVIFIVNPVDYLTKILPLTLKLNAAGSYVQALPFPIKFIESTVIESGKAILGLSKKYFMGVASNQKVDYSDEAHFLEDERIYVTKMLANGRPIDNNSFILLDISELKVDGAKTVSLANVTKSSDKVTTVASNTEENSDKPTTVSK